MNEQKPRKKNARWNYPRIVLAILIVVLIPTTFYVISKGIENSREMTILHREGYLIKYEEYLIKDGDTLFSIARNHLDNHPDLYEDGFEKVLYNIEYFNDLYEDQPIKYGDIIYLPYLVYDENY